MSHLKRKSRKKYYCLRCLRTRNDYSFLLPDSMFRYVYGSVNGFCFDCLGVLSDISSQTRKTGVPYVQ